MNNLIHHSMTLEIDFLMLFIGRTFVATTTLLGNFPPLISLITNLNLYVYFKILRYLYSCILSEMGLPDQDGPLESLRRSVEAEQGISIRPFDAVLL